MVVMCKIGKVVKVCLDWEEVGREKKKKNERVKGKREK